MVWRSCLPVKSNRQLNMVFLFMITLINTSVIYCRLEQLHMIEAACICTGAMHQTSAPKILLEVGWDRLKFGRKR